MKNIEGIPNHHILFVQQYGLTPRKFIDSCGITFKYLRKPHTYSKKDMLSEYVNLANKIGRVPSATDINNENKINELMPTYVTLVNRFGSLETVRQLSNITFTKRKKSNGGKFTTEFLCSELRRFHNEHNRIPIQIDFEKRNSGFPSRKTFTNHFGSFSNALKAAGFDVKERVEYTREYLLSEINRYIIEYGRQPTSKEIDETKGFPSKSYYQSVFGSWNNALKEIGLKILSNRYTDEDLDAAFFSFIEKHGRPPTTHEFNDTDGEYPSFWCYQNRFGSWNKTIIHYGFEPSEGTAGKWFMFDNGEICKSSYEHDVSQWLRNNNISYLRNVLYREFVDDYSGKKDCDYVIIRNGEWIWLEIAGLISSRDKKSNMEKKYIERFNHKVNELLPHFNSKILYPEDFKTKSLDEIFSFLWDIPICPWEYGEPVYQGIAPEVDLNYLSEDDEQYEVV